MGIIHQLLRNVVLMSALLSWLSAQCIKTVLTLVTTHKFNPERMFGAGGMPSAHSAMVCSLTMGVAHSSRVDSPVFAVVFCFAAIVIYDAMGVRRAAGEQARVINKVVNTLERTQGEELEEKDLQEYLGHTPLQVLAGILLGFVVWMIVV